MSDTESDLHLWSTMSGSLFNQIYSGKTFIKLTNASETHRHITYKDGLNIDPLEFRAFAQCTEGGIYFILEEHAHRWIHYAEEIGAMHFMRKVTIPDDANVYIENEKYKVD